MNKCAFYVMNQKKEMSVLTVKNLMISSRKTDLYYKNN